MLKLFDWEKRGCLHDYILLGWLGSVFRELSNRAQVWHIWSLLPQIYLFQVVQVWSRFPQSFIELRLWNEIWTRFTFRPFASTIKWHDGVIRVFNFPLPSRLLLAWVFCVLQSFTLLLTASLAFYTWKHLRFVCSLSTRVLCGCIWRGSSYLHFSLYRAYVISLLLQYYFKSNLKS